MLSVWDDVKIRQLKVIELRDEGGVPLFTCWQRPGCAFVLFVIFQLILLTAIGALLTSVHLSPFELWGKRCPATTDISFTGPAGVLWLIHSQLYWEKRTTTKKIQIFISTWPAGAKGAADYLLACCNVSVIPCKKLFFSSFFICINCMRH